MERLVEGESGSINCQESGAEKARRKAKELKWVQSPQDPCSLMASLGTQRRGHEHAEERGSSSGLITDESFIFSWASLREIPQLHEGPIKNSVVVI